MSLRSLAASVSLAAPDDLTTFAKNFIVIFGDPFYGMEAYGPFPSHDEALEWAEAVEHKTSDRSWWIVQLENPHL